LRVLRLHTFDAVSVSSFSLQMSLTGRGEFGEGFVAEGASEFRHPWHPPLAEGDGKGSGVLMVNNSLTGRREPFVPMQGRSVRWYTCGPTVYDSTHIGHARSYLTFDIMRRIMSDYFNYNVLYQINITDIDDKIILRARQNKLVADLGADSSVGFSQLKEMAYKAVEEARLGNVTKTAKLEAAIKEAKESGNKRALDESEEFLKIHEQKLENFGKEVEAIKAVGENGKQDRSALIAAAKSLLAPMLDEEKGDTVTDHDVFNAHARKFEREYMEDMAALGIRDPDVLTRVTEYIPHIIEFIKRIEEKGMAYESNGSVYLSLDEFKTEHNYRKLSPANQDTSEAELAESEGALGDSNAISKRNKNDFALWKASKPGEPAWDSPWGKGRPGWHIECSVIASDILGERLDMHAGGEDLKFPHHDNELAQAEACFGSQQWVNYFVHAGHLNIKGLKMSKSLKNFITIREALTRHSPRQLRILFLLQPWDSQMAFSDQKMDDAKVKEKYFRTFFEEVENLSRNDYLEEEVGWRMGEEDRKLAQSLLETQQTVHAALLDNFDTPRAMTAMLDLVGKANLYFRLGNLKPAILLLRRIAMYLTFILRVFGVVQGNDGFGFESGAKSEGSDVSPFVSTLVNFRDEIRTLVKNAANKKDPALQKILEACDYFRDNTLVNLGVRLEDRADGVKWNLEDPETLRGEIEEKLRREKEERLEKLKVKIAAKEKELKKWKDAQQEPSEYFKTGAFTAFDEEGFPTHAMGNEEPLTKGARKKLKRELDNHKKAHATLLEKSHGNVEAFIAGIARELEDMEIDMQK